MRESTFTLVYWGFIPSFPTKGQLDKKQFPFFLVNRRWATVWSHRKPSNLGDHRGPLPPGESGEKWRWWRPVVFVLPPWVEADLSGDLDLGTRWDWVWNLEFWVMWVSKQQGTFEWNGNFKIIFQFQRFSPWKLQSTSLDSSRLPSWRIWTGRRERLPFHFYYGNLRVPHPPMPPRQEIRPHYIRGYLGGGGIGVVPNIFPWIYDLVLSLKLHHWNASPGTRARAWCCPGGIRLVKVMWICGPLTRPGKRMKHQTSWVNDNLQQLNHFLILFFIYFITNTVVLFLVDMPTIRTISSMMTYSNCILQYQWPRWRCWCESMVSTVWNWRFCKRWIWRFFCDV